MSTEVIDVVPESDAEIAATFPPQVLKRILALRKLHAEIEDTVDSEYRAERVALEKKYHDLRAPLHDKRRDIVNGLIEVEDITPPQEGAPAAEEGDDIKGIPGFWLQALGNHPVTGELITEDDAEALGSLEDITVSYEDDYATFVLTFHFKENAYFTNSVLTKKYVLSDLLDEKSPQLEEIEGTVIEWKEGKNLTVKEIKKKQKAKGGKNKGQVRTIVRHVPQPSFFHYFSDPKSCDDEDEEEKEEEKEGEDGGDSRIKLNEEEDFEVGHAIRTSILPEAVLWFTGENREDDDFEFGDDEEEDEDEMEEGDDDEDDGEAPTKDKKGKKNNGAGFAAPSSSGAGGEQPECKQN